MKFSCLVACALPLFGLAQASTIPEQRNEVLLQIVAHERPDQPLSTSNKDKEATMRSVRSGFEASYKQMEEIIMGPGKHYAPPLCAPVTG